MKGTLGYHSDDGGIFQNGMTIAEAKPYGDVVGFNRKTSEVFSHSNIKLFSRKN